MNIIGLELRRILASRRMIFLIAVLLGLNVLLSVFFTRQGAPGSDSINAGSYRKLYADIVKMDDSERLKYLERTMHEISADRNYRCRYELNRSAEYMLFDRVRSEVNLCLSHKKLTEDNIDKARDFLDSGIENSSSAEKKLVCQIRDYKSVLSINVVSGPSEGFESFTSNRITDFIIIIFSLVTAAFFFLRDRYTGEHYLYATSFHGRHMLPAARALAAALAVAVLSMLMYGGNIIISLVPYGTGDVTRALQSVSTFCNSTSHIILWQYVLLFMASKIISQCAAACFLCFLATLIRRQAGYYVISIAVTALSVVTYRAVSPSSAFNLLKYSGIYAALQVNDIWDYTIVSVAGMPWHFASVWILQVTAVILVSFYFTVLLYSCEWKNEVFHRRRRKSISVHSLSIFAEEGCRLFFTGRYILILSVLIIISILSARPVYEEFYYTTDRYEEEYIDTLHGPATRSKDEYLAREERRFRRLNDEYSRGQISEKRYDSIMRQKAAFDHIADTVYPEIKNRGGYIIRTTGYSILTGGPESAGLEYRISFLMLLFIIYPMALLYGMEYQSGAETLVRSTVHGGFETHMARGMWGIIVILFSMAAIYGNVYYRVFRHFGISDIKSPAVSLPYVVSFPASVTISDYMILTLVIRFAAYCLVMIVMILISEKTRNVLDTCSAGILLFMVPLALAYINVPGADHLLMNPLFIGFLH